MSAVVAVNLIIDKGTTFEETFYFTNDDGTALTLTDVSVTSSLRKHSLAKNYFSFDTDFILEQGGIIISMLPNITSSLPSGRCVYDIILEDSNGKKRKLVEGNVIVKDSVSL